MARVDLLSTRAGRVSVFEAVAVSGAAYRGEKVVEGLVSARGIAGCIEVHKEAADDCEHDSGQLGSAEAAHAVLKGCEPVGGRGPPEAGPEGFSRGVVQPAEHTEVRLALWSGDRGPSAGKGYRVGLVGSHAY